MSELQLAEKEGLNKLVYIPFHDQQSSLPKLIRQYGDMFIEMQKECFKKIDVQVCFNNHVEPIDRQNMDWDEFYAYAKEMRDLNLPTRLIHLKPVDLHEDYDGIVFLVCEYESKGLDKYIPPHIKAFGNLPPKTLEGLLAGMLPDGCLWDFTVFSFIAPWCGSYE